MNLISAAVAVMLAGTAATITVAELNAYQRTADDIVAAMQAVHAQELAINNAVRAAAHLPPDTGGQ